MLKKIAAWLAPYGLMEPRRRRQLEAARAHDRVRLAERRTALLARISEEAGSSRPFSYEEAVDVLAATGIDETMVRDGSVPEGSLAFIAAALPDGYDAAPVGVHVGNFVGVSLTALTSALRQRHDRALVISVDPAMPHRGVERPDRAALGLLDSFGLTANSMVITGFSQGANVRDDGFVFPTGERAGVATKEQVAANRRADVACEQVLPNLARILPGSCSVVMLDGNHDGDYLRTEMESVDRLLAPGGLLVLDDVQPGTWEGILAVFEELASDRGYEQVGTDGRVGVLRRRS